MRRLGGLEFCKACCNVASITQSRGYTKSESGILYTEDDNDNGEDEGLEKVCVRSCRRAVEEHDGV